MCCDFLILAISCPWSLCSSVRICQAQQYDIYCWALDSAVNTDGWARQNIMQQSYVVTDVNSSTSPVGGLKIENFH